VNFYYLDASAWVKRYYQEAGTAWVQALFDQDCILACASLGIIEVMATLARKRKAREIDAALFEQKAGELEDDWAGFVQVQFTDEVLEAAKDVARRLAVRGADAIHLASALMLQRRFADASDQLLLVASDYRLKQAAQASGMTVIDPETAES
jgi:predicted nucleic acid-binding protein